MHPMKVKFAAQILEEADTAQAPESDKLLFNPCEDEQNQ